MKLIAKRSELFQSFLTTFLQSFIINANAENPSENVSWNL